ncbi:MAG: pseudaminic acid cytidylyltransferase [Candidatus Zixiibacteriota bacterium]
MRNLAIIPARGGSKRIKDKNIKIFLGSPIITYTIKAALASNCFDEVMVSTDSSKIAEIAIAHGAKVPFMRSVENSNDHANTAQVVIEVLNQYKKIGKSFEYGCCLYPTAPFITIDKICASFARIKESGAPSVIPIVPFSYPVQRAIRISENGLAFVMPEFSQTRSQDLPKLYHDAGQFYWFQVDKFLQSQVLLMEGSLEFMCEELEVQDIDTDVDWKLAELKYRLMNDIKKAKTT